MAKAWQEERKEKTKAAILEAAARMLRGQGMRGTSVAKLMSEAGLTVGGFYAHFRSKEQLILESFRAMMAANTARLEALPPGRLQRVKLFVTWYLSREHRDTPETGCPILPLVYEAGSGSQDFRRKFAKEIEATFKTRTKQLDLSPGEESMDQVLATFSTLLGAQLLARATRGTPLSDQVLDAALKSLAKQLDGEKA